MSVGNSTTEYKMAASTRTRNMGVKVVFEVRNAETLHSIFQMRYASKPCYIEVGMDHDIMLTRKRTYLNLLSWLKVSKRRRSVQLPL